MHCSFSILEPLSTIKSVTRCTKSIVKSSRSPLPPLGSRVQLGEVRLGLGHLSCRDFVLGKYCYMGIRAAFGERIEKERARVKINKFDGETAIHMRLHLLNLGRWSTAEDSDLVLPDLLDHLLQVVLHLGRVGKKSCPILVSLPAQNLVTAGSEAVVETVLGAPLHLGVELGEVRLVVLIIRDIKDDSNTEMSVRHS